MPDDTEPVFGGVPAIPAPAVFESARKNNPAWYRMLEAAYAEFAARPEHAGRYADPKGRGATLEQAWLTYTLFGVEPYCVLARPMPAGATQGIRRLVRSSADQLLAYLKSLRAAEGSLGEQMLIHDGRNGHCIVITDHDPVRERFVYHDPWPQRSLLCLENNAAGIDAQPEGTRWSVTTDELQRVAFAAFFLPHRWARVQGVAFDQYYDAWTQGEFFKFFHLKPVDEGPDQGLTRRRFAPGPFRGQVSVVVDARADGRLVRASLLLARPWIRGNLLLALDIAKSFVACFAPSPDREAYEPISRALWDLRDPQRAAGAGDADATASAGTRCARAFMGLAPTESVSTDFAHLSIGSVVMDAVPVQAIEITLL